MTIISILIPWALLLSGNNFYRRLMVMAPHLYLVMAQASALHLSLSLCLSLCLYLSLYLSLYLYLVMAQASVLHLFSLCLSVSL